MRTDSLSGFAGPGERSIPRGQSLACSQAEWAFPAKDRRKADRAGGVAARPATVRQAARALGTAVVLLFVCLLPPSLQAQAWDTLEAEVRALLQPIRASWDSLPPKDAEQILANARTWLAADPEQQQALRDRHAAWMELPPPQRAAARQRLQAWESLSPAQREALKEGSRRFAELPPNLQEQARERFRELPLEARLAYLLPAEQRAAAALAQRLFPFVGEGEREASLAMLAGLGKDGRNRFEQMARRMSPQQREALRQRLLALPPEQRQQFLDRN